jgi:hypothetical protein
MKTALYLVTYAYYDRVLGRGFSGVHDLEDHTRDGVVYEIANEHVRGVKNIYECIPGGACTDITAEIAAAVARQLHREQEPVSYALTNWLHNHHPRGVTSTRNLIAA